MDAHAATKKVKQYFQEMNGEGGSVAFQVESVERDARYEGETWVVICSFFRSIHAPERTTFSVLVSAASGIEKVTPLTPPSVLTPTP